MRDGRELNDEAFARVLDGAQAPRALDEARMLALVNALERSRPSWSNGPSQSFTSTLRRQIVAQSAALSLAPITEPISLLDRAATRYGVRNERMRRSYRSLVAAAVAAALLMVSGAVLASARNAIPGQWTYKVKRIEEGARLLVTRGSFSRGSLELSLARERLKEVNELADAHVRDQNLYLSTLADMDVATVRGAELLIRASRGGSGQRPLQLLAAFAAAQKGRLSSFVTELPGQAAVSGSTSLALLDKLIDRVQRVMTGCSCPANPLELPQAQPAGRPEPSSVGCSCSSAPVVDGQAPDASPATTPSGSPSPSGAPSPSPKATQTPSGPSGPIPGVDPSNPSGMANGILNRFGISIPPTPIPLPTATPTLVP